MLREHRRQRFRSRFVAEAHAADLGEDPPQHRAAAAPCPDGVQLDRATRHLATVGVAATVDEVLVDHALHPQRSRGGGHEGAPATRGDEQDGGEDLVDLLLDARVRVW